MITSCAPPNRIPISVIIAMYNTGKYIGECLDSFLEQTFKEFEIIVIDDCSTDNGNEVVRGYEQKFNGRLKLVRLKKNSGNNGIPNNTGLALSRGEYVVFMDSDDTVTPDMLEKLYTDAKKFDADVVACEKHYFIPEEFWYNRKNFEPWSYQEGDFVDEPTLITDDLSERVKLANQRKFIWNIWSKLIRRDFLVDNDITITNEMLNDMLLTSFLVFSVKRWVRVPYVLNYYRVLTSSITHKKIEPARQLKRYLRALTVGFRHLDNFLSKREFYQQNPAVKEMALDTYFKEAWNLYISKVYHQVPLAERVAMLQEEFALADNTALQAFLFERMANAAIAPKSPNKIAPLITGRIDIQLKPKEGIGRLQILSVSDSDANIKKSTWLKNGEVGYFIQSIEGKTTIDARAFKEGQISIRLRGMDVRYPKDKSKRVPYWIDYTKLTVNGKTLFEKVTPVWHDKPYAYNFDAKAGDKIKIEAEWQPHMTYTLDK
mgnify:CR=1 FL=1